MRLLPAQRYHKYPMSFAPRSACIALLMALILTLVVIPIPLPAQTGDIRHSFRWTACNPV